MERHELQRIAIDSVDTLLIKHLWALLIGSTADPLGTCRANGKILLDNLDIAPMVGGDLTGEEAELVRQHCLARLEHVWAEIEELVRLRLS